MIPRAFRLLPFLLTAFQVFAAEDAPAPAEKEARSVKQTGDVGMVWKVSGGKADLYIAGSMHVLKSSDYPLPEPYGRAYAASTRVVMEITPGEMEKPEVIQRIVEMSLLPAGDLEKRVSGEAWTSLQTWSAGSGVSMDMLKRMKPWMVSLTVAMNAYARSGYRQDLGIEKHFGEKLKKDGKAAEGLETAAYQIGLFDGLSETLQEKMILQAVKEAGHMDEYAKKLAGAWRAGDLKKLEEVMGESLKEYPDLAKILLTDRNAAWMKRIGELLEGEETAMLLVGAGHLGGEGGVLDLLEKKGFRCEQLKPSVKEEKPAAVPARKAA